MSDTLQQYSHFVTNVRHTVFTIAEITIRLYAHCRNIQIQTVQKCPAKEANALLNPTLGA